MRRLLFALAALVLAGCSANDELPSYLGGNAGQAPVSSGGAGGGGAGGAGGTSGPLSIPDGCQPLLGGPGGNGNCTLPYPSDFFLVADSSTATGVRVEHDGAGKLEGSHHALADTTEWRKMDGFSRLTPIVALLGSTPVHDGLTGILDDPTPTLAATSPTVVVEASTGAFVPHFVDVDARANTDGHTALVIHPLVPLKEKTRYVVAFQGVHDDSGGLAVVPEGFRRIRDREKDASLTTLAARFETDVFPVLTKAGVGREGLQLAWDFTTGSDADVESDMRRIRELTLDWLKTNTPTVTITSVKEHESAMYWRTIRGTIAVPSFLTAVPPDYGGTLFRDAQGNVVQNGTTTVDFVAHVPDTVRDDFGPARILCYGHGFFGTTDELAGGSAQTIASTLKTVLVGIPWWGMSDGDKGAVANSLGSAPGKVFDFEDRVYQAMANWMVTSTAIRTAFHDLPDFHRPASGPGTSTDPSGKSNAGALLFDDGTLDFIGISQGHILGGTLAALHPDFERIVLNVGGADLSTMMFRAAPFGPFLVLLDTVFPDRMDQQTFAAMAQRHFDRIDPGFWAQHVLQDHLPDSPVDRRVLQQAGLGDSQVPNVGSFFHARALGIPQVSPSALAVWGLEQKPAPITGSAFAVWDFGLDTSYYAKATIPPLNHVHDMLRIDPNALKQMDAFLRDDSMVINPCGGVCEGSLH